MQFNSDVVAENASEDAASSIGLRPRQVECLAWAQEGKSAGDIGQILGISGRTVEKHLARAAEALGVRTRVQAVVRARGLGILRDQDHQRVPPEARRFART